MEKSKIDELLQKQKIKLEMNITGVKLRKIHTLHIKKQFAKQWQKDKPNKSNKKKLARLQLKRNQTKLQIFFLSKNVKLLHKIKYYTSAKFAI